MLLFIVMGFGKFAAYEGNPELLAILDDMPAPVIEAMNLNAFNLTTVTGFYGVMITYFGLLVSIAAAMWGSDIISKEERDKTVEFSLTLPVKRSSLVTAKTFAAMVNCIGLLLFTWIFVLIGASPYQTNSAFYQLVSLSMLALFIMEMIFLAVGLMLGCVMKQYKRVSAVAVSLLLGTYLISIISGLDPDLEFLHFLSPFSYFDPGNLLREASLNPTYVLLSAAIIGVSMVTAYITYARRDLYI